jgi:hypothetical protein
VKTFTAPIASIRRDGGTQIRAALDEATVAAYAEAIKAGVKLPPVRVWDDIKTLWLSDGFHRVEAALRAGLERINVERVNGGQRDALLDAIGANAAHGLPRSNADKRRAIEAMLADPEWVTWTDRRIAAYAHVGHDLVARVREESIGGNATPAHRVTKDNRKFPVSKPGQPTADQFPISANPAVKDEGAGVTGAAQPAAMHPAPAPDEPWAPCSDVHVGPPCPGTNPAPNDPRDRLINVERLLRDAQAEIAPLLAKGEAMAIQGALNDALRVVRVALGDGVAATQERLADKPMSWAADQQERHAKVGRYEPKPRKLTIEINGQTVDPDVFDDIPDPTDDDLAF